ncbi:GIY-YIG nuclease family protein [Clostridium perfringens]|uniref:GIY-YIG nuclease family protein n=1 Tax=Clostridium perfringens TaxID=1502 RepID=UPI0039E75EDB
MRQNDRTIKLEAFRDHQVHAVLKNSGINPKKLGKSREWFEVDLETAQKVINAVKLNYANLSNSGVVKQSPIIFRPEQDACIEKVVNHFKKANRFLINAKMRYGKTFVSLKIIKRCKFKKQ